MFEGKTMTEKIYENGYEFCKIAVVKQLKDIRLNAGDEEEQLIALEKYIEELEEVK